MNIQTVMENLYKSELNCRISTFWDGDYDVFLGDRVNGYKDECSFKTLDECAQWLHEVAIKQYPDSNYAKNNIFKSEYKYFYLILIDDTGKTSKWAIANNKGDFKLGEIKWYAPWRQYCFFPGNNVVFNKTCMLDILDFIDQLNALRSTKVMDGSTA